MLLVINPKSGKNQIKPYLCDIIDLYVSNGYTVTVHTTRYAKDARWIVRETSHNYDIVVCAGGDGTLDEVCSGLMDSDSKALLGYIPAGTTNDFAKSLGIASKVMSAAQTVITGMPFACDLGEFNNVPFIYVAAFGVFTQVSYQTPQSMKNMIGHMAYIIEGMKSLATIKPQHAVVTYEDQVIEDDFIFGMVSNSVSVGGFKALTPDGVALDDGLYEVLLVYPVENPMELQWLGNDLLTRNTESNRFVYFRTAHISFSAQEEVPWTLDGEFGGATRQAEIINHSRAVTFATGTVQSPEENSPNTSE